MLEFLLENERTVLLSFTHPSEFITNLVKDLSTDLIFKMCQLRILELRIVFVLISSNKSKFSFEIFIFVIDLRNLLRFDIFSCKGILTIASLNNHT